MNKEGGNSSWRSSPSGGNRKKRWENEQILSEIENQNRLRDQDKVPRKVFLRDLSHTLVLRALQFFFFCLAVSLFLYAQDENRSSGVASLQNIYPLELVSFAAAVFSINTATTCFDYALFYMLEVLWTGHYDIVYYAYSIHGALGHILSLIIAINVLTPMQVLQKVGSLHSFTSTCIIISVCYAFKEFYLRRHLKHLLKIRLKKKLAKMEEWSHILSKLGLHQALAEDQDVDEDIIVDDNEGSEVAFNPISSGGGLKMSSSESNSKQCHHRFSSSDEMNSLRGKGSGCISCCFLTNSNCNRPGTNENTLTSDETDTFQWDEERQESKVQLSFWRQLEILKKGHLHVSARFGYATIRSRKQAEAFGNKLYMHLTNGNTIPFTAANISEIMMQNPFHTVSKNDSLTYVCHPLTPDRYNTLDIESGGTIDMVSSALRLFRCGENLNNQDGASPPVTQSNMVNGVVNVFKEIQFSRASLRDLNSLHEAAKSVVDMIFFAFMLLVAQIILKVEVSQILAPLLTILFGLSFAFAQVLSNLFLSMAFVMFLLPFNVGNRVIIGRTDKIVGNIFEMSLMNTTVLTRHNEKLRIPNHLLFHEHITNLSEGSVSTFEIPVVFALDGPLKCSQEKIHTFINNVKKFAKEDNKQDWIDVIVFCDEVSFSTNQMKYTFWCTHRAAFDEVIRCYNGHTRMLEEMRRLQIELDIHFQKALKLL